MKKIWCYNSYNKLKQHYKKNKKKMKNINNNIRNFCNKIKNCKLNKVRQKVNWINLNQC